MKKNLKLLSVMTLSAGLIFAAPVFGATRSIDITETKISLGSINADWKEISDKNTLHTFTNGTDVITVLRYDSDDTLPTPEKAGGKYEAVFQTYYSAGDTVYIVTGSAVKQKDMDEVRSIMECISYPVAEKTASSNSNSSSGKNAAASGNEKYNENNVNSKNEEVNDSGDSYDENEAADESYHENTETDESYDKTASVNDPYDLYSWDYGTNSFIPFQEAGGDGQPIGRGEGWFYYDEEIGAYLPW